MRTNNLMPIVGYKGYYTVSTEGEVYSNNRVIELPGGRNRRVKSKVLRQKENVSGYKTVVLCLNGEQKTKYVHRLVAGAFIDNPDNLPYVNHINGDPNNNCMENLEWVTHGQNVKHAYDNNLNSNKGGTHGFAVGVIDNELGMKFETIREWTKARGIRYNTGRNILNGYSTSKKVNKTLIIKLNSNAERVDNK